MAYTPVHPGAEGLKKPLVWSVGFHLILFGSLGASALFSHRGETWGGSGGGDNAISVGVVAKLPGITLPRPDAVTTGRVVDTSKGLYKSEPQPKPKEIEPDTKKIPEFSKEKTPHYVTRPSKTTGRQHASPNQCRPLRRRRCPGASLFAIYRERRDAGRHGVLRPRRRRRRIRRALPRLRGRSAQSHQQQLAAIHSGPVSPLGPTSPVYISDSARWDRNQYSAKPNQRQSFGGQFGA